VFYCYLFTEHQFNPTVPSRALFGYCGGNGIRPQPLFESDAVSKLAASNKSIQLFSHSMLPGLPRRPC